MFKVGFDNEAYLKTQSEKIAERIAKFGGKLYLEFGGKLFDDHHASRVLPGFAPDSKIRMLEKLKDKPKSLSPSMRVTSKRTRSAATSVLPTTRTCSA